MLDQLKNPQLRGRDRWLVHLICSLITAASAYSVYWFTIRPSQVHEQRAQQESTKLDRLLAKVEATKKRYDDLSKTVTELTGRQRRLQERIPQTPQEASYLTLVTETANRVGLTINNYRPGRVTLQEKYSEMELQLSAKGSYAAICQFIDGIETASRLTGIQRMVIDSKSADDEYPMELTLVLYFGVGGNSNKEKYHG